MEDSIDSELACLAEKDEVDVVGVCPLCELAAAGLEGVSPGHEVRGQIR